jgi:hypothetical protein
MAHDKRRRCRLSPPTPTKTPRQRIEPTPPLCSPSSSSSISFPCTAAQAMAARLCLVLLLPACLCAAVASARSHFEPGIRLPSEHMSAASEGDSADDSVGTRWAVLIAGSNGYYNYRHQVRACSDHPVDCLRSRNSLFALDRSSTHAPSRSPGSRVNRGHPRMI